MFLLMKKLHRRDDTSSPNGTNQNGPNATLSKSGRSTRNQPTSGYDKEAGTRFSGHNISAATTRDVAAEMQQSQHNTTHDTANTLTTAEDDDDDDNDLDDPLQDKIEKRPFERKYMFQRPRALHYHDGHGHVSGHENEDILRDLKRQRGRLDLLIDLVWVGIISNISEHYYEQAFGPDGNIGRAVGDFILLFLPAWRLWSSLQAFLSSFYKDDTLQRILLIWYLICGITYGNNAPFFLQSSGDKLETTPSSDYLIVTYLVAVHSLSFTEVLYSFWIPWLRRTVLVAFCLSIPSIGLWIATTLEKGNTQIGLLIGAICYDYAVYVFMRSRAADVLFHKKQRIAHDPEYVRERYESFFIIALGEAVFLLIRGSPLGQGYNVALGRGVLAFMILYPIYWLYFNGDQSIHFVHAVHRTWWSFLIWQFLHIVMFADLVQLSSGLLYLIDFKTPFGVDGSDASAKLRIRQEALSEGSNEISGSSNVSAPTLQTALAATSINIAIILTCQTLLALLNEPRLKAAAPVVRSRYIRLLPRIMATIVFYAWWVHSFDTTTFLGFATLMLWVVLLWETFASMDAEAKWFEPRPVHHHHLENGHEHEHAH